ncbi:hypothetical protein AL542_00260 [Grimontia hollisae]|uniref:Uncharacterized protein n=2 Tax=Grimontia hollisae TaxID=673 RepID=D0I8V1_GRIHO|nr:hypothetical protein [Grimontia hollisae]AMG28923.1 hypothetical protein AL542_00260 [Grimontia hollisae]EEY71866.1 hypothetical protein VHA_002288 [Grimontia hollisae CIP 101886]STO77257.1 Uncharacterised protein [Grimontia hollisae]STO98376.1 Uncharacterised protein [Grimontia hollisae]STQ75800.1 Uncharacterised protein [Grimontia hollisae]
MRYLIIKTIIISSTLFSGFCLATSEQVGEVVTEKNEAICKQKFAQELFTQQRIFSSERSGPEKRRVAERKIEAARLKYNDTASYCDAYEKLITFEPETLDRRPGDAQFK